MFHPGLHELIASNPCLRQFTGFEIGAARPIRGIDWTIVGHFDQADTQQCAVLTDAETLMATFSNNAYTRVAAMLQSPGDFAVLRHELETHPTLHLEVKRERDAIEEGIRQLNGLLNFAEKPGMAVIWRCA